MLLFLAARFFVPADFLADFLVPARLDAPLGRARFFALLLAAFLALPLDFFFPAFFRPADFFDVFLDGILFSSSARFLL